MDATGMMNMFDFFCAGMGVIVIIMGITEIVQKKPYGKDPGMYTKESLEKFAPIEGVLCIVIGIGALCIFFSRTYEFLPKFFVYVGWVLLFGGVVAVTVLTKKMLKEKDTFSDIKKKF